MLRAKGFLSAATSPSSFAPLATSGVTHWMAQELRKNFDVLKLPPLSPFTFALTRKGGGREEGGRGGQKVLPILLRVSLFEGSVTRFQGLSRSSSVLKGVLIGLHLKRSQLGEEGGEEEEMELEEVVEGPVGGWEIRPRKIKRVSNIVLVPPPPPLFLLGFFNLVCKTKSGKLRSIPKKLPKTLSITEGGKWDERLERTSVDELSVALARKIEDGEELISLRELLAEGGGWTPKVLLDDVVHRLFPPPPVGSGEVEVLGSFGAGGAASFIRVGGKDVRFIERTMIHVKSVVKVSLSRRGKKKEGEEGEEETWKRGKMCHLSESEFDFLLLGFPPSHPFHLCKMYLIPSSVLVREGVVAPEGGKLEGREVGFMTLETPFEKDEGKKDQESETNEAPKVNGRKPRSSSAAVKERTKRMERYLVGVAEGEEEQVQRGKLLGVLKESRRQIPCSV